MTPRLAPALLATVLGLTAGALPGAVAAQARSAGLHPGGADGAVLATLRRIAATLRSSRYNHSLNVNEREGRYEFDCAGFTAWVLARSAPRAGHAIAVRTGGQRPLARDFYREIAAIAPGTAARGWARVARVDEAIPGDVMAWLRPPEIQSANTGHVVIFVAPPVAVATVPGAYLVRVADASQYQHQDDSRTGTGRNGFGLGTILVVADPRTGAPVAYGWFGLNSPWVLATPMAIGRPLR